MAEKGRSTQDLVNAFPDWANVRVDEQSLGFQFFNTIGKELDDARKQLQRIADNYYLPTSIVSDIDLYYRIKLSDSYTFTKDDDDDTDFVFTPPTVSGYTTIESGFAVSIAENNDIETFWYTPSPSRISLSDTVSTDHFLASGFLNKSPFSIIATQSGLTHIPNHITITVSGGVSFVGLQGGTIRKGLVQIEGKNREGSELTEEIVFVQNETQKTLHEFSEIVPSGLRVYGIDTDTTATVSFSSAAFNLPDYPVQYDLDKTINKEDMPLFWALGTSTVGTNTLDLKKYDLDDFELRVEGFTTKHTILQQELQDVSGSAITPNDLAPEPHSDRIWIVDNTNLYVYDNALPYPDLSALSGKDYYADAVVDPNTYYTTINEEVEINYLWRRIARGLVRHRAWMIKPDGTYKSLVNGSETTYDTSATSWVYGEPKRRKIRDTEFYTLDQRGDYVFCLQVQYTDNSYSVDKRIISVVYKQADAQFDLSTLGIGTAQGVDFDSEYNLWVLDNAGTKYKIDRHHDKMLIDFERKIIYFREPYLKVKVY